MSYQRFSVIGNLTDDPEMKYIGEGTPKTTFSVACNERYGQKEEVLYVSVECWEKLAEQAAEYLRKGRKVFVEGKIKEDRWEDSEGNKKRKWYMRAFTITFLDRREDDDERPQRRSPAPSRSRDTRDDSNLPF